MYSANLSDPPQYLMASDVFMQKILAHSNDECKPTKKINDTVEVMELKDRIREAMEGAGLKKLQFAVKVGRSSGAVTQWLQGTTKALKAETASKMERVTGYRADWIVTGKGEKKVSKSATQTQGAIWMTEEARMAAEWIDKLPEDQRIIALNAVGNVVTPWLQGIQPSPEQADSYPAKKPVAKRSA